MSPVLKAIIFDFDGVLASTEPLHLRAFQTILSERGIDLSEEEYAHNYVGLTDAECFEAVSHAHRHSLPASDLKRLIERKSALMLRAIETHDVLISGMVEFVRSLLGRYRLAVASCAMRTEIERSLQPTGLIDAFEVIAAAEDVRAGKPDPAIYVHVLNRLQERDVLWGTDCLAIEDTSIGIQAAQAAGMKCLAVATTLPMKRLKTADAVVPSLIRCDFPKVTERLWS